MREQQKTTTSVLLFRSAMLQSTNATLLNDTWFQNEFRELPLYFFILQATISFLAVAGNGVVIYLICTKTRLHFAANSFVLSLGLADFLVGLFLPAFFVVCQVWLRCEMDIYNLFFNLFTFVSIANLLVLTVDRYILIVHPLRYPSYVSFRRILTTLLVTWAIPGFFSFLPIFWRYSSSEDVKSRATKAHAIVVVTAFEVVPTVVMPAMYAHIIHTSRRHARQVTAQNAQLEFNKVNVKLSKTGTTWFSRASQQNKRERKSESSSIAVVGAVISLFVLCWSFDTVISFCTKLDLCKIERRLFRVADLMIYANSAVNPLVYAFLKKDIKRELNTICRCRRTALENND